MECVHVNVEIILKKIKGLSKNKGDWRRKEKKLVIIKIKAIQVFGRK
jgi:hypothetical protein